MIQSFKASLGCFERKSRHHRTNNKSKTSSSNNKVRASSRSRKTNSSHKVNNHKARTRRISNRKKTIRLRRKTSRKRNRSSSLVRRLLLHPVLRNSKVNSLHRPQAKDRLNNRRALAKEKMKR